MLKKLLFGLVLAASPALAQDYPTSTVSFVVPSSAGGSIDTLARIVAQDMSKTLGQQIIVENVGGAGGTIGTQRVTAAEADGYTLLFTNMALATYPALYPDAEIDPSRDLSALGLVAKVPMVLAASNKSGVKDVAALQEFMRGKAGAANFGTGGSGSTGELASALFLQQTGLSATLVPYKGMGPAIADLVAGHVDALFDQTPTMVGLHNGHSVVALAVASKSRVSQLPDVPTFAEAGVPDFEMEVWYTLLAPKDTPQPIIATLSAALRTALSDEAVKKRFEELAAILPVPAEQEPTYMQSLIASDTARLTAMIDKTEAAKQ